MTRFKQQRHLLTENAIVMNRARRVGQSIDLFAINPSLVRQPFQTDQEGIPRESRSRRVGRISVTERTKRQNLPYALAGRCQEIHEAIRSRTKIPHTATRR
jgi:hypothetical protein